MGAMKLRVIKADHGDAFLLLANGAKVLIDGGPSGVYNQFLREQLIKLESDDADQPRIDLLIMSHIDADHIDGVLDLTAELLEARAEQRDPIVRIDRAWHNSFSDIISSAGINTSSKVKSESASVASVFGELFPDTDNSQNSKLVLSSVSQGRQLRLDLIALNVDLNARFKDRMALQGFASSPWKCGDLEISVVGPTEYEVKALRLEWEKQLEKILNKNNAARTAAAISLDKSVSNLASIVVIAESNHKTALLTGDARGDLIIKWLEDTGRMKKNGKVHFDIVKLPHHGSARSISADFFERVTANHYVVSGNGRHGNPEPSVLEMLFTARPDLNYRIHMTYGPEELKRSADFVKAGNVEKLDKVLFKKRRIETLNFIHEHQAFLDVVV